MSPAEVILKIAELVSAAFGFSFLWKSWVDPEWLHQLNGPATRNMNIRSIAAREDAVKLYDRRRVAFLVMAAIGLGVMVYHVAFGLLSFLPSSWGTMNEDQDYHSYRELFALASACFGGVGIPATILYFIEKRLRRP